MLPEHAELAMVWGNMIDRCYNPKNRKFHHYGGRGITVCDRWHNFLDFAGDMAPRPPGLSLDRIDVNGGYSPDNCRWATDHQQATNRRNNIFLTIDGVTKTASEWAESTGKCNATILHRRRNGWSDKDAVFGRTFLKRYPTITYMGESLTAMGWSKKLGIHKARIAQRIKDGKTLEQVFAPTRVYKRRATNGTR